MPIIHGWVTTLCCVILDLLVYKSVSDTYSLQWTLLRWGGKHGHLDVGLSCRPCLVLGGHRLGSSLDHRWSQRWHLLDLILHHQPWNSQMNIHYLIHIHDASHKWSQRWHLLDLILHHQPWNSQMNIHYLIHIHDTSHKRLIHIHDTSHKWMNIAG